MGIAILRMSFWWNEGHEPGAYFAFPIDYEISFSSTVPGLNQNGAGMTDH